MFPGRPTICWPAVIAGSLAIVLIDLAIAAHPGPGQIAVDASPAPSPAASPAAPPAGTPEPAAGARLVAPARLQLPTIGVDARVVAVGATPQNTMDVPQDVHDVGWYAPGVLPGQPGDAVIDGHLDWYTGPAVFANLGSLHVGDRVVVVLADGTPLAFRVTRLASYPVNQPPADLFSRDGPPRLSLITCTGRWDGHQYQRRLVVDAEPAG